MVTAILSRALIVVCGMLYPAYASFKAVRRKSHREYTKWMMYWIVFALFQALETLTDTFIAWFPLYYEVKILFILWLVLPITEGSKQLYKLLIHPFLMRNEDQIDDYITKAGKSGLDAIRRMSREGINRAATTVVTSAIKGQAVITETLLRAQQQDPAAPGSRGNNNSSDQTDGTGGEAPPPSSQQEPHPYAAPPTTTTAGVPRERGTSSSSSSTYGSERFVSTSSETRPSSSDSEPFEVIEEEEEAEAFPSSRTGSFASSSSEQQQQPVVDLTGDYGSTTELHKRVQ